MRDAARAYLDAGLCVLPAVRAEKRPAIKGKWEPYKDRLPTRPEVDAWFANDHDALCLVCGNVSGNLEMTDFDYAGELFEPWCEKVRAAASGLLEKLTIEGTQSDGWHTAYLHQDDACGSMKLAQRKRPVRDEEITLNKKGQEVVILHGKEYVVRIDDDGSKYAIITLIETKGEGGLFLCDPTPGYELVQGSFTNLPVLTGEERDILLRYARELNEYTPPVGTRGHTLAPGAIGAKGAAGGPSGGGLRPGDDFNARGDVRALLRKHGWTLDKEGENERWCRPGKEKGTSATLKDGVFYVFTSNAPPFQPDDYYEPFGVYALLEHGGDFEQAARALRAEGYGGDEADDGDVDISALVSQAGGCQSKGEAAEALIHPLRDLIEGFTGLNPPIIHKMLRQGETMNIIASPKVGKSWFVSHLAICIASGLDWLGFPVEQGRVLHIDNELHDNTLAYRYGVVSEALKIPHRLYSGNVDVVSLRGKLRDLYSLGSIFQGIEPGEYRLVIIDAFYRTLPRDTDENDNGAIANLYNAIDGYAARLGCAFVLIHHASKGNQSGKAVTDVGAGAGSQSRAADAHVVIRPHEEDGIFVMESAVRSWPPVDALALQWDWPLFRPTESVDTSTLLGLAKPKAKAKDVPLEDFVAQCIAAKDPCSKRSVRYDAAQQFGLSERKADEMLDLAVERGLSHRVRQGSYMVYIANRPGVTGDKGLLTAALLAHRPDASAQDIADEAGVTKRYVNQVRSEIQDLREQ